MQDLIGKAEKFIFIENQFFITAAGETETNGALNQIGMALAKKIVESVRSQVTFKIYIVIPAVPGMPGRFEKNTGQESTDRRFQ